MKKHFQKILYLVIILLIISNILTFVLMRPDQVKDTEKISMTCSPENCYLTRSLELSGEKAKTILQIREEYLGRATPLATELRQTQAGLLMEMVSGNHSGHASDSLQDHILTVQQKLLNLAIQQYHDISVILDSVERERLNRTYFLAFDCDTSLCKIRCQ